MTHLNTIPKLKRAVLLSTCAVVSINAALHAQITKVEHFFVTSPVAESLYDFFKTELKAPVLWKYQRWGEFESGGVSLGNTVMEFVNYPGVTSTAFAGIALEPRQTLTELLPILDEIHIRHDTIQSTLFTSADGAVDGWHNMNLYGLLPDEAGLFICDYVRKADVIAHRQKGTEALAALHGGPLGIEYVREIQIGTPEPETYANALTKLPGVRQKMTWLFVFEKGPALRLVKSDKNEITRIVIKVKSQKAAKKFLMSKGWIMIHNRALMLNTQQGRGLLIEFSEKK